ncbi:Ste13p [Lachancea thermotolerans CBS 6340]|uniref:KLTH0D10318p n=1 Tax=Lachancea thermotolerans (strain ATCC 56472 / CBS 6340 / NRRL Y-8284) TaxID=559295 RepID=C5DEW5_LACTC|nr:KLTH0D10318p [Lachancea thermotolerans CBS 6340]CAR22720.1 KLTH0D10318p [Lachancea thermotolerans CBS 6340]
MEPSYKKRHPSLYLLKSNSSAQFMPAQEFELQPKGEAPGTAGKLPRDEEAQVTDGADFLSRVPFRDFQNRIRVRKSAVIFLALIISWLTVGFSVLRFKDSNLSLSKPASPSGRTFSIENVLNGEFSYYDTYFKFIRPGVLHQPQDNDPGLYLKIENKNGIPKYVAKQLVDVEFYKELGRTSFTYGDVEYQVSDFDVSHRLDKAILATDLEKKFRHSSTAYYWLKDIPTNTYRPISPFPEDGKLYKLSFARFSPHRNFVYFVYNNDLYVQSATNSQGFRRLTADGSEDVKNGRPDWVYEEEVLASDQAVWWAPDDSQIVFAKFNDSEVLTESVPTYINEQAYDDVQQIKYPKPGTPNPRVQLFSYKMSEGVTYSIPFGGETGGRILYAAQWLDNNHFMFKDTDRASQAMFVKIYESNARKVSTVRIINATAYSGWIEKVKDVQPIPPSEIHGRSELSYVDVQVDESGYPHLFHFKSVFASTGTQLTFGDWEVTGKGIVGYDQDADSVFFLSNRLSRFSQHLFMVPLREDSTKAAHGLQDPRDRDSFYEFELSVSCRFGVKRYLGPDEPMSDAGVLTSLLLNDQSRAITQLTSNAGMLEALKKYDLPKSSFSSTQLDDDVQIDYKETVPYDFDPRKKHPLLIHVYGGPGSQTVDHKFAISLEESLASSANAIVLSIEPRGTGGRGWPYRSWAKNKIGYWEPRDIISVVKDYVNKHSDSIDPDHVAIWGWSYGGFVTLKTLELDQGQIFKYGVAVAPVTNWKYYNSIYTERYLGLFENNEKAYEDTSLIKDVQNFSSVKRFLLIHGSADDNVHVKNTMQLLDNFNLNNVKNYDLSIFPDSEHSIVFHNANRVVYERIFNWIKNAFEGKLDNLSW